MKPPMLRFGVSDGRLSLTVPHGAQISGGRGSCLQGHPLPSNTHLPHPTVWEHPSSSSILRKAISEHKGSVSRIHLLRSVKLATEKRVSTRVPTKHLGPSESGFQVCLLFSESVLKQGRNTNKNTQEFLWESLRQVCFCPGFTSAVC